MHLAIKTELAYRFEFLQRHPWLAADNVAGLLPLDRHLQQRRVDGNGFWPT
ncbi:MAG: hypothetical protein R2932_22815 [Caldilineaceae bacterium]